MMSISLAPDQVHIRWRATASLAHPALAEARSLLSADELLRADRYHLAHARRDSAAAHALLRTSLSRCSKVEPHRWTFKSGLNGKPELSGWPSASAGLTFSLSHTRGLVACAIARSEEVGIDVERTDLTFDPSGIVSRYFTPEEIVQLERCRPQDRASRFVDLWTLKEAYAKATGHGLSDAVSDFGFLIDGDRIRFMPRVNVNPAAWQFALFAVEPHYRIGVAIGCRHTTAWTISMGGL